HLRSRSHTLLVEIASKLAPHDVLLFQRWNGLEDFDLLVTNGFAVHSHRGFHREIAQNLEKMILDDVADGSRLIVESTAALYAEILRHRDLHALNIVAVPERLHERIGEAENDHVVHRALPQVMIDPENRGFVELSEKNLIQMSRRFQIVTERLFDDDTGIGRAAAMRELLEHRLEHGGRNREVVGRPLRRFQFSPQRSESFGLPVVSIHVTEQAGKFLKSSCIHSAVILEAIVGPCLQLLQVPASLGDADDRYVEMTALDHRLQRGKYLLVREVPGCTEENKRIGMRIFHCPLL